MTMGFAVLILPLLASLPSSVLGAAARFAVVEDVAILPAGNAGVLPRWYNMKSIPATPAELLSPNPGDIFFRNGEDGGSQKALVQCPAGQHSCVEAEGPDFCCGNDRYCYLDKDWNTKCCSLGNKCEESYCDAAHIFCNTTITSTITTTVAPTETDDRSGSEIGTATVIVTPIISPACCDRACGDSSFSCAQTFGGQCCQYGFKCALNSDCIADPTQSTSDTISSVVSIIPPGCTAATQFSCAQTDGGGCCDVGSVCVYQDVAPATSTAACSPSPDPSDGNGSSGALSNDGRVGVGVGVALGAAIIIGAVTWLCIRRRRQKGHGKSNASAYEMAQDRGVGGMPTTITTTPGRSPGGRGGGLAVRLGRARSRYSQMAAGPLTPWTRRSVFSESSDTTISSARPPLHDHGRVYSYFGPSAVPGPFTEREEDEYLAREREGTVSASPPNAPPVRDSTVPFSADVPYHPDNIMRPVELGDGKDEKKEKDKGQEGGNPIVIESEVEGDPTAGRFELMGSLGTPSPLNPDGIEERAEKGSTPQPQDAEKR